MLLSEAVGATADPQIPSLGVVLNPIELRKHLKIFTRAPWRWQNLGDVGVRALRFHSGRRCTVEIIVCTSAGAQTLVGKVYAQNGLPIYETMRRLSQSGFGPEAEYSVPTPLAFLAELQFLLQEKVKGESAEELLLTGKERARISAAERSARWLAQFHAAAPKAGLELHLDSYLAALERWSRRVSELGEPFTTKARQLFHRLELAAAALRPIDMCAGHGDFKPQHVILAGNRTATCDWDRFDVADPWRDVGRYVIALKRLALRHLGSLRALNDAGELFLKTYAATGRPGMDRNLPFHMAATCVQLAKYDLSQQATNWREEIAALLDEGLCILEEGYASV